jgi:hypothetical protein
MNQRWKILAATALALKATLLTADARLHAFPQLRTVW